MKPPDLTFVNITDPKQRNEETLRRDVRSRAAAHSHRVGPRKPKPSRRKKANTARDEEQKQSEVDTRPKVDRKSSSSSKTSDSPTFDAHENSLVLSKTLPLPDPLILDASRKDPFNSYPVPNKPWFGCLLDYWYRDLFPQVTMLLDISRESALSFNNWVHREALQEPAYFYMCLATACVNFIAMEKLPLIYGLWLRGQTVRAINDALNDPKRGVRNALIMAVGGVALHESLYGDRRMAHRVHRPAQQRMIALRGGFEALGLPLQAVQFLVWVDKFMAAQNGISYFEDVPKSLSVRDYTHEQAEEAIEFALEVTRNHPGYGEEESLPEEIVDLSSSSMPAARAESSQQDTASRMVSWQSES